MEDFEAKLKEYRKKKKRELRYARIRQYFQGFWQFGRRKNGAGGENEVIDSTLQVKDKQGFNENSREDSRVYHQFQPKEDETKGASLIFSDVAEGEELGTAKSPQDLALKYTFYIVSLLFWITLYKIAIELEFGIVFLICSALFGIYFNTRTGPKRPDEVSAYSVFNKNCVSIHGTLKAEQFERELGIR